MEYQDKEKQSNLKTICEVGSINAWNLTDNIISKDHFSQISTIVSANDLVRIFILKNIVTCN